MLIRWKMCVFCGKVEKYEILFRNQNLSHPITITTTVDSMGIYLTYKERYKQTNKQTNKPNPNHRNHHRKRSKHSQVVAERVDVGGRLVYLDIAVQDVENIGMK